MLRKIAVVFPLSIIHGSLLRLNDNLSDEIAGYSSYVKINRRLLEIK